MEIISADVEITQKMKEGIQRILYMEKEIKDLQEEKKIIKKDMKEQGVNLKVANKTLTLLKRNAKEKNDPNVKEALDYVEEFKDDENINTMLADLFNKN